MMTRPAPLNGPAVGIILKELVRRAIVTIRNERQVFDVTNKTGYGGDMNDVFTSADRKAQEVYLKLLRECFPDHGIVAEEDALSIPATNGVTGYFTVDPLDGTKAFIRRQSHGVGTMIALVEDGRVVAAYVGDVNTQEIYGYRYGSGRVHRITEFETAEELVAKASVTADRYILLRDPESAYSQQSRAIIGRFKSFEVEGGSMVDCHRKIASTICVPFLLLAMFFSDHRLGQLNLVIIKPVEMSSIAEFRSRSHWTGQLSSYVNGAIGLLTLVFKALGRVSGGTGFLLQFSASSLF